MNKLTVAAMVAALVALPAVPAMAGWKLVDTNVETKINKSAMVATPGEQWNRWSVRPIKTSEVWTLDGVALNELYFVTGLASGGTLYRDAKKKDQPLPKLSASMDLTDIPGFVESSTRIALATSVFEMTSVEPAKLGSEPAIKFAYTYAVEGSPLKRRGMGVGTIKKGSLYLVTFVAPDLYYFERDQPKVEKIIESIRL